MTITLTARQHEALFWIARNGGGLAGGRENTRTMNQLADKGLVHLRGGVTPAGLQFLVNFPFTAEWMTSEHFTECHEAFVASLAEVTA